MGKVSIVRTHKGIKKSLIEALDLIGGLKKFVCADDRVLIKPNLNGVEGCTNIVLVESLIQILQDMNVRKICIAESTFGNSQMTAMFFNKTGYTELAQRYSIEIYNLNASRVIEVPVENPLILDTIRIAEEVYEADTIINVPNMKVHYATGVTLAMKNLKGLLVGDEKRHFHEVGLDKAIVDLNNIISPALNIVDCITCMERMGPRGGDNVELNLILAGENIAEVDYVGCKIMDYDISEVRHLDYFVHMHTIAVDSIEIVGECLEDVRRPFKKVSLDTIIPEKIRVHNVDACSSCMNAFLLSCSLIPGVLKEWFDIYLGSIVEEEDIPGKLRLAFGNCCPDDASFHKRIRGCPPFPFALGECLKEYLS